MALQNPDHDPRQNLSRDRTQIDDLGDELAVNRASRSGWRWWWVWPVVIVLGVVFWWSGWGRTDRAAKDAIIPAPAGSRTTETLANAGAQQPIANGGVGSAKQHMSGTGVQAVTAQNKQDFIGKPIEVNDVPVQQKVSSRALWIGTNHPILAVVTGNGSSTEKGLEDGKVIDAKGTVQKAPPESQAKQDWALSDQDASRLEQQGAYVQISELSVPMQ